MSPSARNTLLDCLVRYAYDFKPGGFKLSSGQVSDEYLDCKQALSHSEAMIALGALVLERLPAEVVAVGGLTMGADPLAMAACMASAARGRAVRWFAVRKQPKEHGRKKLIEGDVASGDAVAVVDDVVTTGGSTIEAIRKAREAGLCVARVLVLVDREQSGMDAIRAAVGADVPVEALYTKSEIKRAWLQAHDRPLSSSLSG